MICFASNATGWDVDTQALVPGGQVDRLITPITDHLPRGSWTVARQPLAGAINVYLSNRDRYISGSRRFDRFGVSYAHGIADKGYRRGETSRNRRFDWITVPGPAHARGLRADRVPASRVITVGYPKLDPLFNAPRVPRAKDGPLRVLYAPTHGGGSERHVNGNPRALAPARPPGGTATRSSPCWMSTASRSRWRHTHDTTRSAGRRSASTCQRTSPSSTAGRRSTRRWRWASPWCSPRG